MDKIYYQPDHLWKGQKAVKKLKELSRDKPKAVKQWLSRHSRFKVARPLRTKQARDVAEMLADIYKVGPLTYSSIFQCDNGSKFKEDVTKMLEKNEGKIR